MDIEAFSNNDFDAVSWINSTYKNSDNPENKEVFVATLVSKLQLYVQQINSALEDTSQQVLASLPRVMKDAQNLQNEVHSLKSKMTEVQTEISQVQNETGACMTNLERLDGLKTKLQVAKQGLQESDGWGKLISELEDLFERNDLTKICLKLGTLQKSLAAQEGLPGQSDRESQVEGLKNRLEALASPSVVQGFTVCDIEQSKKFVEIFGNMNRLPQLMQYYRTVQKTTLQQHWNEVIDLSENSNRFLHDYYEFLGENYQKQVRWCNQVFGDIGPNEAVMVLIELLPSLQPTRQSAVLDSLKRSNEKLDVLMEFSSANYYFATLLGKIFQQNSCQPNANIFALLSQSVFGYFNTFIAQYPAIEQNFLATSLANLTLLQSTATETIRTLGNANKKVFDWINKSLERCEKITQYCAIAPLATVLNSILKTFLEKYKKAQQQLTASRSIDQDWSLLQNCMSLLQNIGDFKSSIIELETLFAEKVLTTNEKFQQINDNYLGYKLTEKRELNEFKKLVFKVKESQQYSMTAADKIDETHSYAVFLSIFEFLKPICVEVHDTTLAAVFAPIEKQLGNVEPSEIINASGTDLPDYSFAPQEFITQVGQYLLTLPQHLEPLLLSPSTSLKIALETCDQKYTRNIPSADILLSLVVDECCAMYQSQIFKIQSVSLTGAKQLATDIEYLGSVLEELGLTLGGQLQQTTTLLRATPEKYLALSSGCEPKLVTAIRQMRNIISTE